MAKVPELSDGAEVDETLIRQLCSHCHQFPEPDVLPRSAWRKNVMEMATFPGFGVNVYREVDLNGVAEWYEKRAPVQLSLPRDDVEVDPGPLRLRKRTFSPRGGPADPAVSNVALADVTGDARLELVVCEMAHGLVLLGKPYEPTGELQIIADVPHPARAEVVDLDGDGRNDLLVANLGSFLPLDHNLGSVEWLRQQEDGTFERVTLFDGIGRVADVRAVDFNGNGRLDLVVAEFGWRVTGQVHVLENRTESWDQPVFVAHPVEGRTGAIHVPAVDLDGDGRPDFVALLSQEHEMVVACLNRGDFRFENRLLYQAPHPAWGSSGLQLVDLDGDGRLDILVSNGDTLDDGRLKPYHGITWLRNTGDLQFEPQRLVRFPGVHRALAADLDGDGVLDIVACAFADPEGASPKRHPSVICLMQTEPGRFERYVLEVGELRHMTLAVGDFDLDGDVDFAIGNAAHAGSELSSWVDLWENLGNDPAE